MMGATSLGARRLRWRGTATAGGFRVSTRSRPGPGAILKGLVLAIAGLALTACEEAPAPRFDAPLASGVITLPMPATQRFDTLMSHHGLLAALSGGDHAHVGVEAVGTDAAVIVAHLPRARFDAAILGLGARAVEVLADDGYALVVGSGFVSVFNPESPLGLLQLDGEIKSEPSRHGYSRILGTRDNNLVIIGRQDYHPGLFESAMQVGPGIVEAGQLDILRRERELPAYIRAFVATCEDRWLAGVTQLPMHLYDLGERLLNYLEVRKLRCDEVANLSGDREALLAIRSDDDGSIAYFGNPSLPRASIVAFKARAVAR